MEEKKGDNFYKKYRRRSFWISIFAIIPCFLYVLIWPLTNSQLIGVVSAIVGLLLFAFAFFYSGIYKEFW